MARTSPQWWMSREALMARAFDKRQSHLRTAELMMRAVLSERMDSSLPALATWDDVQSERRQAKLFKFAFLHLRGLPAGQPLTGAQWAHIKEMARVQAWGPAWRAREAVCRAVS